MATRSTDALAAGRAFFERLRADGAFSDVFAISGEERYLVDEAVSRLILSVFPSGKDDFNLDVFQAGERKGLDIASACEQLPMFASKRVVVVRAGEHFKAADWEPLATYCERPSSSTLLILEGTKFEQRSNAAKRVFKAKGVTSVTFPLLGERDAAGWLVRRAKSRGLTLDREVAPYLVEALGASLQQLDLALERIDLYIGAAAEDRRLTVARATEVVPDTRVRSVFELADALGARDLGTALRCFHRMLEHGDSPIGALTMIARQFRQMLLHHDGQRQRLPERDLARYVGCPPFRLRDVARSARLFTPAQLQGILRDVLVTDRALKSSRLPSSLHVERLFVTICR